MTKSTKKGVYSWMLADWAGQPFHTLLVTFVFTPYFVEYGLGGGEQGQASWGYMIAIASIIIALASPVLGAMADTSGPRKPWIFGFSVIFVIGCMGLWLGTPNTDTPLLILCLFGAALIATEISFIFINAMLPDMGTKDEIGRISGSGWALGYLGGLASLILVLGFMAADASTGRTMIGMSPILGLDPVMHEGDRAAGPLAAIWYVIFIIPMFLYTYDVPRKEVSSTVKVGLQSLLKTLQSLPQRPSMMTYLGSSMLYRDGLAALYTFGGIYGVGVLGLTIIEIGTFGLLANLTGAMGAWLGGRMDARFGPKPVVAVSILVLIAASLGVISTTQTSFLGSPLADGSTLPLTIFYICGAFIGAAGGAVQAASRTLLIRQAENDEVMTQSFGLYGLAGKATAFIGPLSIAIVTDITGSQRFGISPIVVLFIFGGVLLYWVKPNGDHRA